MSTKEHYYEIIDQAVRSMRMAGLNPTDDDRRLAYMCLTGRMTYRDVLESIKD